MNRLLFILTLWLCNLVLPAHALASDDEFNPNTPPNPDMPVPSYWLTLKSLPDGAGSFGMGSPESVKEGSNLYLWTYGNSGYVFDYWEEDGKIISRESSFYYTMPGHNATLTAVFHFDPAVPDNPSTPPIKHWMTLDAQPWYAGAFSWNARSEVIEGMEIDVCAYNHDGYQFVEWQQDGKTVSTENLYRFTVPDHNFTLLAIYEYNPAPPANPGRNYFNNGEVIIDDFTPGSLATAVYQLMNGVMDEVKAFTVIGVANPSDWGTARNMQQCEVMDFSRASGVGDVPSWCFETLKSLRSVSLPSTVQQIGYGAFYGCESLKELTCYALTPPVIGDQAFSGVPEGLVVYVPAEVVTLYQEAQGWSNFTVLPLREQVSSLVVNLPEETEVSLYKDMFLEVVNLSNSQRQRYVVTDRLTYTFNSLINNTHYNVYLKNQNGEILGAIKDVALAEEDLVVTFESLLVPRTVTLQVLTPDGSDVTDGVSVTWSDAKGNYLSRGSQLSNLLDGTQVSCHITLPQSLAMQYMLPADVTHVVGADNQLVCQLTAIGSVNISGIVRNLRTNAPIYNASVTAMQTIHGLYSKSATVKTDAQGSWSLQVLDMPTELTFSANDYISETVSLDSLQKLSGNVTLRDLEGTSIELILNYTTVGGETTEYADYANVDFTVRNAAGEELKGLNIQYPQIVLPEKLASGTVLYVTATSRTQKFMPVTTEAVVDDADRATAQLSIKQLGGVKAGYSQTDNRGVVGILYDGEGNMVGRYQYAESALVVNELPDGSYTLVSMGESQFFNSFYTVSHFREAGLRKGIDYLVNQVTVESGKTAVVQNTVIPYFDESRFYYTDATASLVANKASVVVGNYLTLKGQVAFKPDYAAKVSDVELLIDLPKQCSIVQNSVLTNHGVASYTVSGNRIIVPLSSWPETVRLCVVPTAGGNYSPSASIAFKADGKSYLQPIGSADFSVKNLSINVPSLVAKTSIPVSGTAIGKSVVEIYDNGILIGQTTALVNGAWATSCELNETSSYSTHEIYAKVTTSDGLSMVSETKNLVYDANAIQVSKVVMYHNNPEMGKTYEVVFDYLNPTTEAQKYTYYIYNRDFSFTVDFTSNDPTKIHNVMLYVKTGKNNIIPIEATYNERKGLWYAQGQFGNYYDGDIPVNVYVDFDLIHGDPINNASFQQVEENIIESFNDLVAGNVGALLNFNVKEQTADHFTLECADKLQGKILAEIEFSRLDYATAYSDMNQHQYSYASVGNGYFCVLDAIQEGTFQTTIVDTEAQYACKVRINNVLIPAGSYVGEALASIIRNLKKMDSATLRELGGNFLTLIGAAKYTDMPAFLTWCDLLDQYFQNDQAMRARLTKAVNAQCTDNSFRLTAEQQESYTNQLVGIEKDADAYLKAFAGYLAEYKTRIVYSLLYNLVAGILNNGQALVGDVFMTDPQNASFFQGNLPQRSQTSRRMRSLLQLEFNSMVTNDNTVYNVADGALPQITQHLEVWAPQTNYALMTRYLQLLSQIRTDYKKCTPKKGSVDVIPVYTVVDADPSIDPSGYVYEAVSSNRLQGVTATAYYKETVEDMYGDLHENVVLWNAEEYAQRNPLFTDENGMYRWDVPQGLWQVKFEKDGYQTTYSEWLPVPPPQLDVNIAMTQMIQPLVKSAKAIDKGMEIEFDKYMEPNTLTAENILVLRNGEKINGDIVLVNEEPVTEGSEQTYASKVRFALPEDVKLLSTDKVELTVSRSVKSYAGVPMQEDYHQDFDVESVVESIAVDSMINVTYGGERKVVIAAQPVDAAKGKKMTVKSLSGAIATINVDEVVLDENGQAELIITGELPGQTVVSMQVEGSDVKGQLLVNVKEAERMVTIAPQASRLSGAHVYRGTQIFLTCETENAVIYYTLDGSCPCETATAIKYEAGTPIVIESDNTTIKAMAVALDLQESEVAEFSYTLKKTSLGYQLQEGWNWISHNMDDVVSVDTYQNYAERIVGKNAEAVKNAESGYAGSLTGLLPTEAYKVKVSQKTTDVLQGYEFNASSTGVPVTTGWNWIGYPVGQSMLVDEALAFHNATEGDFIVGQDGFAEFVDGKWIGILEGLVPGHGYMYKSGAEGEIMFNTAIVSVASSRIGKRNLLKNSPWTPVKYAYPDVMPVTAQLTVNGEPANDGTYHVGAFCDTECRGVGLWKDDRLMMNVYGVEGEKIRFVLTNAESGKTYDAENQITLVSDNIGNWHTPYAVIVSDQATGVTLLSKGLLVTPVVFDDHINVNANGNIEKLTLSNMKGQQIITNINLGDNVSIPTSQLTEGIYILTVKTSNQTYCRKVIKSGK